MRRAQLVRRIRPFILRRIKADVATKLPPKHTILRRITLAPAQREFYKIICKRPASALASEAVVLNL